MMIAAVPCRSWPVSRRARVLCVMLLALLVLICRDLIGEGSIGCIVLNCLVEREEFDQTAWLTKRQELISSGESTKVYLFAYMRGGSSLAGTLFDKDPDGLLWYEPMDQFFMAYLGHARWGLPMHLTMLENGQRRSIPAEERHLYAEYIRNILTCDYDNLPTEALSFRDFIGQSSALKFVNSCLQRMSMAACKEYIKPHCGTHGLHERDPQESWRNQCPQLIKWISELPAHNITMIRKLSLELNHLPVNDFIKHQKCMNVLKGIINRCMFQAKNVCHHKQIQAVEVLRSNMDALDDVVAEIPDLFVIYTIRDPRAIIRSTVMNSLNATGGGAWGDEARLLCAKMRLDYHDFSRLRLKYPGAFIMVKYEDLVLRPKDFGKTVYRHIGRNDSSIEWQRFIGYATHAQNPTGQFGLFRKNGAANIDNWRKMADEDIDDMNSYCVDVVQQLGYTV